MAADKGLQFSVQPGGQLNGHIRVPGDKSISHRSIMFGSLALGQTQVSGFLEGEDSLNTLKAFRRMGVDIEVVGPGELLIQGRGLHGLRAPVAPLDLGNSGTAMRLMAGVLAGQSFDSVLTGDSSLSARPMGRVIEPLRQMGARIDSESNGRPPLRISGTPAISGIDYHLPMASAQVKSAILLAGLYAAGETRVTEPAITRDHTERMLEGFGYAVHKDGLSTSLRGGGELQAVDIVVPADLSSAAFFLVGASIAKDSQLTLLQVGINPTRTGVLDILRLMGADLQISNQRVSGGEPVADITVRSAALHGIEIPEELVSLAIDEFPALFVAAACAEGTTVLTGAEELRVKESDRIQVMVDALLQLGVRAESRPDGAVIHGGPLCGGEIDSHGDHRVAMAMAMAALAADGEICINDCANVTTSFPGFVALAGRHGLRIQEHAEAC
ncbi:MAG: 3-phosphoshikimate 1-carboxyvinyltransferase [Gammaproteobacteria bacterium]|nr:3-phosphoshikimate 1-carboxyvinyltransferase [Gammaproteobacteria bacterium]